VTDSEFALFHLQRALWDPVDTRRLGSLLPDLHYRVNGEVYRFSGEKTLRRFMEEPELWCGLLRDPVNGERFWPSTRSPRVWFTGGFYYFSSDSTRDRFVDDPQRYEVKRAI
jgi:YHS domain-containing protein